MRMTPQYFHTIPTSCTILPTAHSTKISTCTYLMHNPSFTHINMALSTTHSTVFRHQDNPHLHCSAGIKVPNITHTLTGHKDSALLMHSQLLHTRLTTSAVLSSNEVAATHNITHSRCTSTCTTHLALPTPQPSTALAPVHAINARHHWQNATSCRDDLKVLWCHSPSSWGDMCLFSFRKPFL